VSELDAALKKRSHLRLQFFLAVTGSLAVFWLAPQYGVGWDSGAHLRYGHQVIDYFASGFLDTTCNEFDDIRHKGPLFDMIGAALQRISGTESFTPYHIAIGFFALLTVLGTVRIASRIGGLRLQVFAAVALASLPRFVGHAFINPKDTPFAAVFVWAIYYAIIVLETKRFSWREMTNLGVLVGTAMAIRSGGVILIVIFALAGLAILYRGESTPTRWLVRNWVRVFDRLALLTVIAWVVMVIPWPYAHGNPIGRPLASILGSMNFHRAYPVLIHGEVFQSDQLPRYYLVWSLFVSTPINLLVLSKLGTVRLVLLWRKETADTKKIAVLCAWGAFPLLYFFTLTPNVYDGIRHFLFLLPLLALLSAVGADWLANQASKVLGGWQSSAVAGAILMLSLVSVCKIHPYQTSYFNLLAGPKETLHEYYDVDYWATALREAAEWINQKQNESGKPLRVVVTGNEYSKDCYAQSSNQRTAVRYEMAPNAGRLPEKYDYSVSIVRYDLHRQYPEAPIVYEVRRGGVLLCLIRGQELTASQ